jgi:hypothetical protein
MAVLLLMLEEWLAKLTEVTEVIPPTREVKTYRHSQVSMITE